MGCLSVVWTPLVTSIKYSKFLLDSKPPDPPRQPSPPPPALPTLSFQPCICKPHTWSVCLSVLLLVPHHVWPAGDDAMSLRHRLYNQEYSGKALERHRICPAHITSPCTVIAMVIAVINSSICGVGSPLAMTPLTMKRCSGLTPRRNTSCHLLYRQLENVIITIFVERVMGCADM